MCANLCTKWDNVNFLRCLFLSLFRTRKETQVLSVAGDYNLPFHGETKLCKKVKKNKKKQKKQTNKQSFWWQVVGTKPQSLVIIDY